MSFYVVGGVALPELAQVAGFCYCIPLLDTRNVLVSQIQQDFISRTEFENWHYCWRVLSRRARKPYLFRHHWRLNRLQKLHRTQATITFYYFVPPSSILPGDHKQRFPLEIALLADREHQLDQIAFQQKVLQDLPFGSMLQLL